MNVLLDLDGTLTDPREGITRCIRHALAALDRPAPPVSELLTWIGPPLHDSFRDFFGGDEVLARRAVGHYRERFADVGWGYGTHRELQDAGASAILDVPSQLATLSPTSIAVAASRE